MSLSPLPPGDLVPDIRAIIAAGSWSVVLRWWLLRSRRRPAIDGVHDVDSPLQIRLVLCLRRIARWFRLADPFHIGNRANPAFGGVSTLYPSSKRRLCNGDLVPGATSPASCSAGSAAASSRSGFS